jgi:hypothetical protein
MAYRVELSPRAFSEAEAIVDFIAAGSTRNAAQGNAPVMRSNQAGCSSGSPFRWSSDSVERQALRVLAASRSAGRAGSKKIG